MREQILYRIQKNFPLTIRPFKEIAEELGTQEGRSFKNNSRRKNNKVIRQTSAIFDTKTGIYLIISCFLKSKNKI